MKWLHILTLTIVSAVLFTACAGVDPMEVSENTSESHNAKVELSQGDYFSQRDLLGSYNAESCAIIELTGDGASCSSDAVIIEGSTITICDEGSYLLCGTLSNGMVIVEAGEDDKTQLILQNAFIHSQTSAPIYVRQADKVFLTLDNGSENLLSCGDSYVAIDEYNIDSVIFSREDLCLNGSGSLSLSSPAGHGIVSKDELTLAGGSCISIDCAGHGLSANDSICIENTNLIISAGKDGIQSENDEDRSLGYIYIQNGSYAIQSEGDGISAGATLSIDGGSFQLLTGGGYQNGEVKTSEDWGHMGGGGRGGFPRPEASTSSNEDSTSIKGLKSTGLMTINGGSFSIDSADDAVHSNSDLIINGGAYTIKSGDDGFHADLALAVNGGSILIQESYEGLEGLSIEINGGTIDLTASDDGFNAAGGTDRSGFGGMRGGDRFGGMGGSSDSFIRISGGIVNIHAYGDGMDANGTLEVSGGDITVCCPTFGDTAVLDYDISGRISGGTFRGTGAYQMAQTFSDTQQAVIAVSVGSQRAGTEISLTNSNDTQLISYSPALDFAIVILSSPELIHGDTYTITVGEVSGNVTAN